MISSVTDTPQVVLITTVGVLEVEALIENIKHPAILDTGATLSCVDESLVPHLIPTMKKVYGLNIKTATADPIHLKGRVTVNIELDKTKLKFPMLLTTGLGAACILGNDFHTAYHTKVDFGRRLVEFTTPEGKNLMLKFGQPNKEVGFVTYSNNVKIESEEEDVGENQWINVEPLSDEETPDPSIRVMCAENTLIPPRRQTLLKIVVEGCLPEKGIIEPNEQLFQNKGLLVPYGLTTREPLEKIIVANFSSKPLFLDAGKEIGSIKEVQEIQNEGNAALNTNNTYEDVYISRINDENDNFLEDQLDINPNLSITQRQQLVQLLRNYNDRFAWNSSLMGRTNLCEHTIETKDSKPVHQAPYRVSHAEREIIRQQVSEMLTNGVIRESRSAYASPVVLVKKKDNTWRFCIDYRALNATLKEGSENYPLPLIQDILSYLNGCQWFTGLDLFAGYWQIPIKEEDKHKTAFITPDGLWEFEVLPFGMKSSPATFQRCMDQVLAGLKWGSCLCYLDDLVVMSDTFDAHLIRLQLVLERLRGANLTLKPSKCSFGYNEIKVLGHVVNPKGILPDPSKVQAIREFPTPRRLRNVRSFLGLANYYRKFVKDFTLIAKPLTQLTKKNVKFNWAKSQEEAFLKLKDVLCTSPVLRHYDEKLPLEVHTDASDLGLGASLVQTEDGESRPILYASRRLSDAEVKYNTTEKELLAIVWAVGMFRQYLWGKSFDIIVDHHALCWLKQSKDVTGRVARWALKLGEYDYQIKHKSGKLHVVPDCLSRNPHRDITITEEEELNDIPTLTIPLADLAKFQEEDPEIKEIMEAVKFPDKSTNSLARCARSYLIEGGILYRKNVQKKGEEKLLVVPSKIRSEIMFECHDSPISGGHLGFTKTFTKLKSRYYWPTMLKDIEKYVKSCIDCQTKKTPKLRPAGLLQPIKVGKPMDRIGIDFLGPFTKTPKGNTYIIVASDYATKWVETKAISGATALEAAQFIVEQIICKHGCPREILSDRGQAFKSKLITGITTNLGIRTNYTSAYHPACNGLVEHVNGTVAEMLSHYVSTHQRDWDMYLPLVTFSYNTSQHETTKRSPFYLMYGREATLPVDAALDHIPNCDDDVELVLERVRQTRRDVLAIIEKSQRKQKQRYDATHRDVAYKPGQMVLVFTPFRRKGRSEKLLHRWHGPHKVVRKISDVNYVVQIRKAGGKVDEDTIHVQRLKPYHSRD